jgi:nicotinate-nucleotide pyrophosphorylase (carboxylating)
MQKESVRKEIKKIVEIALCEDCALDDITSDLTIPKNSIVSFEIKAREDIIFCGHDVISEAFLALKNSPKFKNSKLDFKISAKDGALISKTKSIAFGAGDAKLVFAAERVVLNLIQHLSGVATFTQQFVAALNNKKIKILDTRKTLPGLRFLQKYAVEIGGGKNHRFSLADMILIKDNHIAAAGSIPKALLACADSKLKIEIECDTVEQVVEAIKAKPDVILLDNMKISDIKKSIKIINKKSQIEVSGGVNLKTVKEFSGLEIDFISVGSLTHSARAVDIGLDIV